MSLSDWVRHYEERTWQTADDGTVRYALIGLGWWVTDIAIDAIEDSTFCETTVLVSSSQEKADRIAEANDVPYATTYGEFTDGAHTEHYDAIYVCTPNALHLPYVEAAAEYDKAVLCEKPMEATVERSEEMVEVAESNDVPLMIAYRMHTEPAVQRAKEIIEDGFLGEVVQVYGDNTQPLLRMIPDEDQWRLDPDLTGYGTSVMDLGIYSINTARYLLDHEPLRVQAQMHSGHDAFGDVDDERSAFTLEFEDGVQMISTASQRAHEDTQLKITGTDGQVELRPAFHGEASLRVSKGDVTVDVTHDELDAVGEMREEFDYLADRLLTGEPIYPDGEHGLRDMEIIRAVHEAAERGEPVDLS